MATVSIEIDFCRISGRRASRFERLAFFHSVMRIEIDIMILQRDFKYHLRALPRQIVAAGETERILFASAGLVNVKEVTCPAHTTTLYF